MKQIKVGFLSSHNYLDRNAWSGTVYRMYEALKLSELQIINLGNPQKPSYLTKFVNRIKVKKKSSQIGSDSYIQENKKFAALVKKQLEKTPCDVIFAPVASKEITFLETDIPIVYLSDITFELYRDYYQSNFEAKELEWRSNQESTAISKASKLIYSSEWAAYSAVSDYNAEANKVNVIPFGANIDDPPSIEQVRFANQKTSICRLLFIGKDWQRKGGDIAIQALTSLHKKGINAELTIVGTTPPIETKSEKIKVIPFLDKNNPLQRQKFCELLLQSDCMLFPTRADCSPIVICEANAFGLPVITTDVGGIPTIIKEGKNGYMLPLSASGEDFATVIAEIFSSLNKYKELRRASREEYDNRLNWNSWGKSVCNLILEMV